MIAISSCESIDQLMTEVQNIGTSKAALYCHQLILVSTIICILVNSKYLKHFQKSAALSITNKSIEALRADAELAIPE